jgi:CheY-like chemotaxis protein
MAVNHILIVDDQLDVRRVLRSGLESQGEIFSVVDVPSAEEALLVIARQPIDLLVVDIRLAGMSGLELLDKVNRRNPDSKVVLITGLTDPEIRQEAAQSDADALLFKPIDQDDFLRTVADCLGLGEITPPETIESSIEEVDQISVDDLSTRLLQLRADLGVKSVVLLDDHGQIRAHAGDSLNSLLEPTLVPSLMAALSTGAEVSRVIGVSSPEDLFFFAGTHYDVYLSHVGQSFAILIVSEADIESITPTAVLRHVRPLVNHLILLLAELDASSLDTLGEVVDLSKAETASDDQERAIDLDAVFTEATKKEFGPGEVSDFWDTAVEQHDVKPASGTGELSYEQARRLGLTPDEES